MKRAPAAEAEENDSFFMGSEAPPEPATPDQPPVAEEERVRHAFGRDPDTQPPFGTARADARASAGRAPSGQHRCPNAKAAACRPSQPGSSAA